jgi:L-rhamnose mutarotase
MIDIFICAKARWRKFRYLILVRQWEKVAGRLIRMGRRLCFALDLVDDAALIAEYEARHAPGAVWAAVLAHIRATGVASMEIWRTGDRLVMVAEVTADYPRPIPTPPEIDAWETLMWRFQRPLPHAGEDEKWVPMHRIFALEGA